ncbi:MAG: protein-glutamate O-methyltransferase CheR [Melioribacteraceae bacterium]|jgi:chemotaxis protein methyltransferase CheR|nr:chemotaxis protein CheR [Ignavibacteriota bacterium]MBZ0182667.1 protein-glutamate O-methyltransferase CheR [Melioribacteraceae bacterium]
MNNFANTQAKSPINLTFGNSLLNKDAKLSDKAFEDWRKFIYDICGIYFQDNKKYLLESRLQKRITYLGIKTFEEYLDYVRFNFNRQAELKYLYEVITINETFFFRNQPQLDALVSSVIPDLLNNPAKLNKNRIRIWSAASSSGEEAYSVAILFQELIKPKYPNLTIEIVGTDINHAVVETAQSGVYKEYAIRNAPAYYLKKYFKHENGKYILDEKIRSMVNFKILNLYDEAAMRSMMGYDVIFCANVLIYFDQISKTKVVSQLYNSLIKGGYLFIGYSETLHGISKAFKLISYPKTIGYKKE